jgi:hypothetical protein
MLALLGPIASLLGIEVTSMVERYKREAIVWAVVGGFLTLGTVFGLVAANAALTLNFGPVVAPLILCAIAMAAALATYLVWRLRSASEARSAAERKRSAESTALVTSAAMTALPLLAKSRLFRKAGLPIGGMLAAAYLLSKPSSGSHEEP